MYIYLEETRELSGSKKESNNMVEQVIVPKSLFNFPIEYTEDKALPLGSWRLAQDVKRDCFYLGLAPGNIVENVIKNDPILINNKRIVSSDIKMGKIEIYRGDAITTWIMNEVGSRGKTERLKQIYTIPTKEEYEFELGLLI